MSNNIYDILKKMQSLETPKANLTEGKKAKPDFLDMDKDGDTTEPMKKAAKAKSKGAVAEAVAQVERQLNEKYMGFKEDTRLAMRRGPGADMMRYDKDSPAPGAQQHRDATAKAAKDIRASGKKLGDQDEVKAGDKTVTRYSRTNEGEANEDMLSPGQKKIARMSPPPNKIDANDLKALRAGKDKKKEGAGVMHFKKEQAKADGKDSFKLGDKEYAVKETMFYDPELHKSIQNNLDAKALQQGRDKMAADELRRDNGRYVDSSNTIYDREDGNPSLDGGTTRYQDAKTRDYPVYQTPGVAGGSPDKPVKDTSGGVINKVKDFFGYNKPNPAYGPRDTKVKEGSPKKKTQSPDEQHKVVAGVRDAMRKGYDNVQKGRDERAAARFVAKLKYGSNDSEKTNEGFPTVADAKKRMDDRDGKTAHGKKTITKTGTRHERDYDAVDKGADVDMTPKGRGRPKKDRFA